MKALTALIHREFLEHRGAFLYAPLVILGVFTLVMVSAIGFDKVGPRGFPMTVTSIKLFETAYLFTSALWFAYLLITLFFYFADAFSADRRNNAMLFWKSMPVSDFKVLGSKMLAGGTFFPALIVGAIVAGMLVGHFYPDFGASLKPLGDAFIRLVKMIIAPVIFLVGGIFVGIRIVRRRASLVANDDTPVEAEERTE